VKNTTGANTPPAALTIFSGDDACGAVMSSVQVTDTSAVDPGASPAAARVSFTAGGSNRLFHSQLVNGSGSPVTSTYSWSETTMYSPAWNTSGSYDTFYSFHNTTGKTLNGTLTLLDTTGATASTVALVIPS